MFFLRLTGRGDFSQEARRLYAARRAFGWTGVECVIIYSDTTDKIRPAAAKVPRGCVPPAEATPEADLDAARQSACPARRRWVLRSTNCGTRAATLYYVQLRSVARRVHHRELLPPADRSRIKNGDEVDEAVSSKGSWRDKF
ncbi:unnamed protein product [Amoebophrya sp. A120]|nr:unnamed protein product [Amoebophrya sp. A120]|eukprot:GSA120T00001786001.1